MVSGSFPYYRSESENDSAPISFTQIFYEHLPYYLSIGMSYKQFWEYDCELVKYYRKAHKLKQQERNNELWLQGMYFYEALCKASPLFRSLDKHPKPIPYSEEPYPLSAQEAQEREDTKAREKFEDAKSRVLGWAQHTNKSIRKEE